MKYGYKEGEKSSNNSSIQIREEEKKNLSFVIKIDK